MRNFYFLLFLFLPFLSNAGPGRQQKSDSSELTQGHHIKTKPVDSREFQSLTEAGDIRYDADDMLFYIRAKVNDKTTSNLRQGMIRTHDKTLGSGNTC
ncbi:MAG: hypothetical protein SFU87_08710 [Chitinophagaceae bacterium]|nr:hypothetical protein [Chitinophagaceae bacterium]